MNSPVINEEAAEWYWSPTRRGQRVERRLAKGINNLTIQGFRAFVRFRPGARTQSRHPVKELRST
jgi:hypothetical protein